VAASCVSISLNTIHQIFDETPDASGGRIYNAIITIHTTVKVAVDFNDPGKPDPGTVNKGYNEEMDRPRPDLMDQLLELSVFLLFDPCPR